MDVVQLKCPNCGGSLTFNPEKQSYSCEYCLSDFNQDEIQKVLSDKEEEAQKPAAQEDIYSAPTQEQQDEFNAQTNLYVCDNCGAEIICEENTAATFCYYCHSPVALKGRLTGECRPELVIPFQYTREQTLEMYKNWCKKKWFIPNDFTSEPTLEKIVGLYVPFWLADCKINADMQAEGRKIHSYISGDYNVTHTQVYYVERSAYMSYMGVPADGSKKLDDRLMDAIEPFDYRKFVPFSMSYLSGFFADKYDVSKAEVLPRIKGRIEGGAQQVLAQDVKGYTTLTPQSKRTNIISTTWHYAMLPVWFLTYKYKGKDYFFGMNGQTGKIVGILPVSGAKLALLAAILLAVFGVLGALLGGVLFG